MSGFVLERRFDRCFIFHAGVVLVRSLAAVFGRWGWEGGIYYNRCKMRWAENIFWFCVCFWVGWRSF